MMIPSVYFSGLLPISDIDSQALSVAEVSVACPLVSLISDTSTPYEAKFDAADAGKTAYYRLRWVNRQGESGDWSAIASAVVMD
jgi:hypothetical protein